MTTQEIKEKIEAYLHFWGLELTNVQIAQLVEYLRPFSKDEGDFETEMICEIRSLTD